MSAERQTDSVVDTRALDGLRDVDPDPRDVFDSQCDLCGKELHDDPAIPVAGGSVVGHWKDPVDHYGIAAVDGGEPPLRDWCVSCYEREFDVTVDHPERAVKNVSTISRWITQKTMWAFVSGVILTSLAFLLFASPF